MTLRAKSMTTSEAMTTLHNDLMLSRRTALPGIITRVNTKNGGLVSVDVQPAVYQTVTGEDGIVTKNQALPVVSGVPLVMPRSQTTGFSLTVPVKAGDDVLIVFADRSIDNWQSTGKLAPPAEPVTPRSHDLTDAIAIVGVFNDTTPIENYSFSEISMRNKTGDLCVAVSGNDVTIKNKSVKITVKGDEILLENGTSIIKVEGSEISINNGGSTIKVADSEIEMANGLSSIKIESDKIVIEAETVEISGESFEMGSDSNVTTGGGITSSGGLDFENHIHSDPQGGDTGPPVNP